MKNGGVWNQLCPCRSEMNRRFHCNQDMHKLLEPRFLLKHIQSHRRIKYFCPLADCVCEVWGTRWFIGLMMIDLTLMWLTMAPRGCRQKKIKTKWSHQKRSQRKLSCIDQNPCLAVQVLFVLIHTSTNAYNLMFTLKFAMIYWIFSKLIVLKMWTIWTLFNTLP